MTTFQPKESKIAAVVESKRRREELCDAVTAVDPNYVLVQHTDYHWSIRDEFNRVILHWWPTTNKWHVFKDDVKTAEHRGNINKFLEYIEEELE